LSQETYQVGNDLYNGADDDDVGDDDYDDDAKITSIFPS
jgi:hypothetical protein